MGVPGATEGTGGGGDGGSLEQQEDWGWRWVLHENTPGRGVSECQVLEGNKSAKAGGQDVPNISLTQVE